ncbi:hypothetical protein MTP99_012562 [Tenebrio molitor]|nr:hypothetical protein MTP99_012562 [Tenebrio molitor]
MACRDAAALSNRPRPGRPRPPALAAVFPNVFIYYICTRRVYRSCPHFLRSRSRVYRVYAVRTYAPPGRQTDKQSEPSLLRHLFDCLVRLSLRVMDSGAVF